METATLVTFIAYLLFLTAILEQFGQTRAQT